MPSEQSSKKRQTYPLLGNLGNKTLEEMRAGLTAEEWTILEARADALAQAANREAGPAAESVEVLTFFLGIETYAIDVAHARSARLLDQLTPVPCAPDFVAGVVNMQGSILSLLDISKFLGIRREGITDLMQIIVVEAAGLKIGILANQVGEVTQIPLADLQEPPATVNGLSARYIKGVTLEGLILLDLEAILGDERIIINDEVG